MKLKETQIAAVVAAVSQPGWATDINMLADGVDAIKALREVTPGAEFTLDKYALRGVKAACTKAVSTGFFGASTEALELLVAVGITPSREE